MTDYTKAASTKIETAKKIKLVTFPVRDHRPVIEWEYPEFQCLCPISERHDSGTVVIRYQPNEKILESKSVRDYLASWRNKKIWQEYVTEEIADVFYGSCSPKWLTLEIEWSPRGGIFARTVSKRGEFSKTE